jgi:tetratricopeptide (TPR) repeat protein
LNYISQAHRHLGSAELSITFGKQSVALFVDLDDLEGELQPRGTLALGLIDTDPSGALIEFGRIVDITNDPSARLSDDFRYVTRLNGMSNIAKTLLVIERYEDALAAAQTFLAFSETTTFGGDGNLARAYRHRGFAYLGLGDLTRGRDDLENALKIAGSSRPDWWAAEIQDALDDARPDRGFRKEP